ncbi:MAG: LPS-assembly protein LptD [Proteobacteria bacterium]|nr:LPS-assembly protein LptD [Pseudomonadota bacterium]
MPAAIRRTSSRAPRWPWAIGRMRALALVVLALALDIGTAAAQRSNLRSEPTDLPVLLTADEVNYDRELGVVTALGHVEIAQGDRVLRADTVSYNQRSDLVTATGNVALVESTGEVLFADYVELSSDMRDGTIQNLRMLLADQARIAGVSAVRVDGNLTAIRKGVYSPCEPCADDPTRAPVWQIKAARVTHDQAAQEVTYNDAWIELFGVPVAYTPYLSHPDGTVDRRSGLLTPQLASSSNLGRILTVPYYQVISPSADFTFEPMFLTSEYPVLAGEYRQRTQTGQFNLSGSVTRADRRDDFNNRIDGDQTRGHIKGEGRFDIDNDWRWGFDAARATDDTYIQRYKLQQRYRFLSSNTLTSRLYTEGFRGRDYAAVNSYAFQGLRQRDDPGLAPLVLPMLDYNYVGEPGAYGGRYSLDANALSIYRTEGTRMQRMALAGGWTLPYTAPSGEIYSLSANLLGDAYNVPRIGSAADPSRPTEDGVSGRLFPQLALGWRYPFVRRGEDYRTLIEPIVTVVAAPNLGNQQRFPNEDSRGIDFDDTNLFRSNRFSGIDRLEGGQRVSYGVNTELMRNGGGRVSAFIGQSYRLKSESAFTANSGLQDKASNIVGRLRFLPHPWIGATYSFQADKGDFTATRDVASLTLGPPALQLTVSYVFVERSTQPTLEFDVEQIATQVVARITPNWRIQTRSLTSIAQDSGTLIAGASLIYEDECIVIGLDVSRRNIGTRDNPPDTAAVLRVIFRNLGEVKTGLL